METCGFGGASLIAAGVEESLCLNRPSLAGSGACGLLGADATGTAAGGFESLMVGTVTAFGEGEV